MTQLTNQHTQRHWHDEGPTIKYALPRLSKFTTITIHDLEKLFDSLPQKTSSGVDEISNKIIKHCCD